MSSQSIRLILVYNVDLFWSTTWIPEILTINMSGLKFSQEVMSKDPSCPVETEDIDILLNRLDVEGEISDGALEQVHRFLEKVGGTSQDVNHGLLQRIFKCLQVWALSPALGKLLDVGIVSLLATMFDNFIQSDYSRPDVLASILELLFVVEDMSDSSEGKMQCGKFFLFRLLALATTPNKLPSVRLQRAAIETTCALVTRSPENQLAVLDQKVQCYKLFKEFLPRCGDFQLQASITEMFYRLAKRGPHLLDLVRDEAVRKSIESLLQSKKPNLLSEIRTIVTRINESLGHARSVYSFPAERISINGHNITTTDMWVNFGRAQLSFFITGLPDSDVDEPSVIDLQYEDLVYHKRSSSTLMEILLRPDTPGLSAFKPVSLGESGPSSGVQAQFFFRATDLSNVEAKVFPKIHSFLVGRKGKRTSNSEYIDKSTSKGTKSGPSNFNTFHATNTNSTHPTNQTSPAGDDRLSERKESRGLNEKSSLKYMHTPPDVITQTPRDLETLEGVTTQDYARSKRNVVLGGFTSDWRKSSKPPGRQAQGCYPPVAAVPSTFERFNCHVASGQPFQRRQEDARLQSSNTGPVDAHQNMSMSLPIDGQADVNLSPSAAIAANDSNKTIQRTSTLSHLKTQNLQEPSGPKTKSPADINLRAREIDDETDDRAGYGEIRMKKRHDSQPTNVVPLESPLHDNAQNRLVGNNSRQVSNAELQEAQRSSGSSEKNRVTLRRDIVGSDSVMTDLREKHLTSGKDTKSCRQRSSTGAPNAATGQEENGPKIVPRFLSKRKCKKTTSYFDADDDLTSAASDSYPEIIVTRRKKYRSMHTDPIINKSSKHKSSTQTITRCARLATVPDESKALTKCQRNGPTPNEQPCRQKTSTMAATRKQSCSTNKKESHAGKVPCASSSRKDLVQDELCFTTNPAEEQQLRKTSPVSCKAKRNSDHTQPNRKRRKHPAGESHMLSMPRQRSCIAEGPSTVVRVGPLVQIMQSPPRASPAGSASTKQDDEVTPEQPGAKNGGTSPFSRSSDSEENSGSPLIRTQKTYTKSDKIITKDSRLERWKSFSIRKLEFCTVDATSHDDFSDDATPGNSPHAKAFEVEDAAPDSEDGSDIGMIALLLKRFKQKVKFVEKKKMEDIVSDTMQRIHQEIHSAEEQFRGEKTEFLHSCKKKCGQLDSQIEEQVKKMRAMYDKFKQDFAQEREIHDIIVGEIEATDLKLNELAKQQGQNHKEVLAKLKLSCKNHLTDGDQRIMDVLKSSTGMRGLKDAMQGVLKDL